ncbi:MAG: branched-chain amino acid aminotransferase [Clostridiales bacterium]|jgi:branched-chain amino acid aminotransferase|nr:branched-chain amino acid aminotransferase [Clostridiales bacterium]
MEISITKTNKPKQKPDENNLGFGKIFTDHMFLMNYTTEKGWHDPRIVPYAPIEFSLATMTFHYGQSIFEGLKAYRTQDGDVQLFRPKNNMARLNNSAKRLCIPTIDEDFAVDAIKKLVDVDRDWVPSNPGTSLYIRPFIFGTDEFLGVHPSDSYIFAIICSPSGSYYPEGINPVKIYVEDKYVRAVKGGVGFAKTEANYAVSLKAQDEAEQKGYSQVLWLDGKTGEYIEEVGAMNVFFVIDGEVITPSAEGSILEGITRLSTIELLRAKGYKVTERQLKIAELTEAYDAGKLDEAFGTGTAAVISPMGELCYKGKNMIINNNEIGKISQLVYDQLTGIQYGELPDEFNWVQKV